MLTFTERGYIIQKMEKLAQVDFECNNDYINAPYKLLYGGVWYVGKLSRTKDRVELKIERIAEHVEFVELEQPK